MLTADNRLVRSSSPPSPTTQSRANRDFLKYRKMPAFGGLIFGRLVSGMRHLAFRGRFGARVSGPLGNVIRIDDGRIKSHLDRVVRGSVEETLNALLYAEADRLAMRNVTSATRHGEYWRSFPARLKSTRLSRTSRTLLSLLRSRDSRGDDDHETLYDLASPRQIGCHGRS
jgi:hypothetical protein